jgi:integrase/recombinase XerD
VAAPGEYTPMAQRDCAMLKLMASTGIKVSELIRIPVESVITDSRKLLLVRDGVVTDIYLDEKVHRCLWRYIMAGRCQLVANRGERTLFLNGAGRGLSRQGVWKIIKKHATDAGIGDVTPEMLRRSFARHLLDDGHDLHQLKKILGHSSLSTTKAYIQSSLEKA